jgi:hypothetical protein
MPHAEGDRGDDHVDLVAGERVLVAGADGVVQARVVRHGAHAGAAEEVGERLDVLPAERVDDAALTPPAAHVRDDVLPRATAVALAVGREDQVRAEEGAFEAVGLHHAELADDVADDPPRGRRREGEDRHPAQLGLEAAEPAVRRAEVVAPLGDAVRLVDDHERHADTGEEAPEAALQALGRHVDQLVLARAEPPHAVAALLELERGVDDGGAEAVPHECVDLVLHERDERAHDEDRPGQDARRDLERQRLPRPRRHDADAVAAGEDGRDDLLLARTEVVEAEDAGQDAARVQPGTEVELFDGERIAGTRRRANARG